MEVKAIKFRSGRAIQEEYLGEIEEVDEDRVYAADFNKLKKKIKLTSQRSNDCVSCFIDGNKVGFVHPEADYIRL